MACMVFPAGLEVENFRTTRLSFYISQIQIWRFHSAGLVHYSPKVLMTSSLGLVPSRK